MAIPWGEIIQGVTTVAKAAGKGAAKGAKAAGKAVKSTAKSGKRMAQNIIGEGGRKDSVITSSAPQAIPATPLIPSNITPKTSSLSTGVLSIDKALDRIDNSLFDLIRYTADSSKVQKTSARRMNVERNIQRKRKRESILESSSKFIRGLASKAPKGMKKTFDSMAKFLNNIVIGSILLYILQQWDNIVAAYKKAVETLRKLWKALEPWAKGVWDFFKWISRFVVDWTARLFGVEDPDTKPILQNLKEIGQKLKPTEEEWEKIKKAIDVLKKSLVWGIFGKDRSEESWYKGGEDSSKATEKNIFGRTRDQMGGVERLYMGYWDALTLDIFDFDKQGRIWSGFKNRNKKDNSSGSLVEPTSGSSTGNVFVPPSARKGVTLDSGGEESGSGVFVPPSAREGVTLDPKLTSGNNQGDKLSQGLDTHASYETGGGTTNIILANQAQSSSGSGEGGVKIMPVPLVNSTTDVAAAIYRYELTTV
jgi:hypothetical protein